MRHLIYTYLILGVLCICTSCSDKQYQVLFEQKSQLNDTLSYKSAPTLVDYHIKPQDILQVRNLQDIKYIVNETPVNPTSSANNAAAQGQNFQVEEDGMVALPVIGRVQVAGLTRSEAEKLVEDMYRKKLLKDPIISLTIVNLKVTVLGEIGRQGNFPLTKDKTTLIDLIGEAGGLTDKSNEANIKIIRGSAKNPQVINIDLSNVQSINDPRAILQSGDIIYIAQNSRAARNSNLQNFTTIVTPALILFNTALILYTLIHH